ncbi:MAG: TetR/AcrR family transcriptional regulator [Archangium sp.]|nr:TetR/AcrR family transcriptional regulator [Archangium sp.]
MRVAPRVEAPTSERPKGAGRPRCNESHRAILDATVELLERGSLRTLTIEGIAAEAGVSKQTIYKWWPSKSALVMEAYAGTFGERTPAPNSGRFEDDLLEFMRRALRTLRRPRVARAITGLLAEAQFDDNVHRDLRTLFQNVRREHWRALFKRAIDAGQVSAEADIEVCLDMTLGAIWYRLLFRGRLDDAFAESLAAAVLRSTPGASARRNHANLDAPAKHVSTEGRAHRGGRSEGPTRQRRGLARTA